ncbi:MAG: hypothetical protein E7662_03730 [Ruminococcaceae bacterium]|nr:hypothetical protein [Oscillospiraceae bacterium]
MSNNTGSVYATRQAILARSLCNYSPVERDILHYTYSEFIPGTRDDCMYLEEAYRVFTWEKGHIEYVAFTHCFIDFAVKLHGAVRAYQCRLGETTPQLCLRGLQFRYAAEYRKMQK